MRLCWRLNGQAPPLAFALAGSLAVVTVGGSPQPSPPGTPESIVRGYVQAIEEEDLDAIARLWAPDAPERDATVRTFSSLFRAVDVRFAELATTATSAAAPDRVRVRARAERTETGLGPGTRTRLWARTFDVVFVDGLWRIAVERDTVDDVAELAVSAPAPEARARLLAEHGDLGASALALALTRVADRLHIERDLDRALIAYGLVLDVADAQADVDAIVGALQNIGNIHYVRRAYAEALTMYERRLGLEEARHSTRGITTALQAIASAHYADSRYDLAQAAYLRLLELERGEAPPATIASTLANLGNVAYLQGSYDRALRWYREGAELQARGSDVGDQARLLFGAGRAYAALGAFARALDAQQEALTLRERVGHRPDVATSLHEIGRVQFLQGRLGAARVTYERALAIETELADFNGQGRILLALGLLGATEGRYADAQRAYDASIAAFGQASDARGVGYSWLGRGSVFVETARYEEALADYRKSLGIFEADGDVVGSARALVGLAIAHTERGELREALARARRAAAAAAEVGAADVEWQARYQEGRALASGGALHEARHAYLAAIDTLETTRGETGARGDEGRGVADRVAPYVAMVEWATVAGHVDLAFEFAQRAKTRMIQDVLQEHRWRIAAGMTAADLQDERTLAGTRLTFAHQRRRARARVPQVAEVVVRLDEALGRARAVTSAFEARMDAEHPSWARARGQARPRPPRDIAARLAPDDAVLEYVVGEAATFVFALRRGVDLADPVVAVARIDVTRADLLARIGRFTDGLAAGRAVDTDARELYQLLVAPVAASLRTAEQWVILPDGPLWQLPFAALKSADDRYLVQQAAMTLLPSLTLFDDAEEAGSRERSFAVPLEVLANPPDAPDADAALMPPVSPADESTTLATSSMNAGQARILHAAVRASLNDASPLHSNLALAWPNRLVRDEDSLDARDDRVEAWELLSSRLEADLVVLPCVASPAEPLEGEGIVGLGWALLAAGAKAIVLRRTFDGACPPAAVSALYEALDTPRPLPAVLQRAALALLADADSAAPRFWAGLTAMGPLR